MGKTLTLMRFVLPRRRCVEGPEIPAYERAFAAAVGAGYAAGFWKGRVAFYAALRALGIGEGDEVVMPGYTCMVVPAAAQFLGARPRYVDIEPVYCTLDPDKLCAAITARTRALMIQHTYGWPSHALERVLEIARSRSLPVIEDCCHALGVRQGGRHVGNFGVAGFFSTQWSKPFTTGLGGMLVCNDADLYDRVCRMRESEARPASAKAAAQLACQGLIHHLLVYPATMSLARRSYRWLSRKALIAGSTAKVEYAGWQPDYFRRLSAVQAAAGLCELKHAEAAAAHRRRIASYYSEALAAAGWPVPPVPLDSEVTPLRFPVRVANKDELLRLADRHFVEIGDWFVRPLHSHLAPQETCAYVDGMCPEAERAAREIVNLPVHSRVSLAHAQRAVRFVCEFGRHPGAAEHRSRGLQDSTLSSC